MRLSTRFETYSKITMGIFLLFPIILQAQVKIKERVEISPYQNLINSIQTETHPLNLNIVFTATTENVIRLGAWSECGGSPQSTSGNHSVSLNYPYTGGVVYSPQLHVEDFYKDIPVHITVTLGSRTITDTSYSMYAYPCGGYDQTWTCPSFGISHLYADLKSTFWYPSICTGGYEYIVLEPEYKSCSIGDYDPSTENVTLTVIHGNELGGMTLNGVDIQPSVTLPVKSRNYAWFVARDTLPNGIFIDTAEIQIQAGILTTTKRIPVRNCQEELCPVVSTSKESMAPGDTSIITILGKNSSNVIGPYPPEQTFNVQLTQGAEYGNLQLLSGGPLSKGLTNTPYQCLYIANNEDNSDSILVQVQAWANGQLGKRTDAQNPMVITACGNATEDIVIKGFHHFNISIVPDTLAVADTVAYTEGAKLLVQAQNKDNVDIEYDPSTLLKFSLTTNEDYGTFIKVNGDTLKTTPTTPVQLTDASYNYAKEGKIKFVANKKNPDSLVTCKIRVEKQDDTAQCGEKNMVVLEQTLKIVMSQPYQVRPSIPTENADTSRLRQRKKSFEIKMTRGKKPVQNHLFKLWTNYVDSSGGHIHGDTRDSIRKNNNDNYGFFLVGNLKKRPLDTLTNIEGKFPTAYSASIFGDTMRIYLKSKTKPLFFDSVSVVEKVDSLVLLGINTKYIKVGGTRNHHGPTLYLGQANDHNHWCSKNTLDSLLMVIDDFYDWSLSEEGGGSPIILEINDMSLSLGGRFDIDGLWDHTTNPRKPTQRHYFHRTGSSIDINNTQKRFKVRNPKDSTKTILTSIGLKLEKFMNDHKGKIYEEETIHFDFPK